MSESPSKRRVVLGFIGTVLDAGRADRRFDKWRPTVAMCAHPSLPVDRYELLRDARHSDLAETLAADMRAISPTTEVRQVEMNLTDPWDFEEVFAALHDYCRAYPFDPEAEDYLVNITTGTVGWNSLPPPNRMTIAMIRPIAPRTNAPTRVGLTLRITKLLRRRRGKTRRRLRMWQRPAVRPRSKFLRG